jgi:dihydroxy-acid dehydratase
MTTRKLRSNFEPGTTRWAIRRAQWRALGLSEADMEKPKIAVVNSSSEISICFSHLDAVAVEVKAAIRAAGGLPFEVRTLAPSDFIHGAGRGGRYLLPSRDLLVNEIEVQVEGPQLDGMVCLSSCDKTAPAHLMAAARLDVPAILVACGYQGCGRMGTKPVDIEDVFESAGELAEGNVTVRDIEAMCEVAVTTPGVCAGMGTANTMHAMAEALGMTLPGNAPIPARGPRLAEVARAAGARIVGMVEEDLRPRRIMTPDAFANAIRVGLALSGSINLLRHLQGVAEEGGVPVDVYGLCDRLGPGVPLLCAVKPNGPRRIEELDAAGGVRAVMKRLEPLLARDALTVTGRTVGETLAEYQPPPGEEVLGTLERPAAPGPAIVVLRGSLAPVGAIMKLGLGGKMPAFRGAARVFESQEDALAALARRELRPGMAVVLRGLGARGGPGVASASWFVAAVNGAGLGDGMAVITDGQLSGLNRGYTVGQVLPEAADGGPLALVRDGDEVVIDLAARRLDLAVPETELAARRLRLDEAGPPPSAAGGGWLAQYRALVQPLDRGGVLRARDTKAAAE